MDASCKMVVFTDAIPDEDGGVYAHFDHRRIARDGWQFCDIQAVVRDHEDRWLEDLDRWHNRLSVAGASYTWKWWLLPGSRLTVWYPVYLKPLLFALGVIEATRVQPLEVLHVIDAPDEVIEYFEEYCQAQASPGAPKVLDQRRARRSRARSAGVIWPFGFYLAMFRRLISVVVRLLSRGQTPASNGHARILVWSHTLTAAVMAQVGDHFFGRVFDAWADCRSGGVKWLYQLDLLRERQAVRQYCESVGRNINFDFEWLHWSDILLISWDAITLRVDLRPLRRQLGEMTIGSLRTTSFPRHFVAAAVFGYAPIFELAIYRAVARYLSQVRPEAVIYPYEEKGLERAILRACVEAPFPVRTIGFAHANWNKGHRYIRHRDEVGRPCPDIIATTGVAARRWLMEWGGLAGEKLTVVGSPRFTDAAAPMSAHWPAVPLRVLFIVGYGYEVGMLANYVEAQPDLFLHCELMIRRYPHDWQSSQDYGFSRLRDLGVTFQVDDRDLPTQIEWAHTVLFCATSAGIEAMVRGRLAIHVALDDCISIDSIEGKGAGSEVIRCLTASELKAALTLCALISTSHYAARVKNLQHFAARIYAPFNLDNLLLAMSWSKPAEALLDQ